MHIKDSEWLAFYENGDKSEYILNHVAECDFCAGRMMDFIPQEKIIEPKPYLSDMILKETAKYSMRKQLSSKFEFMFYCIRVGVAMCFALFILFSGNFTRISEQKPQDIKNIESEYNQSSQKGINIAETIRNTTGNLGSALNSFCNSIGDFKFNNEREDKIYENTEK